jgi:hypothetical protein
VGSKKNNSKKHAGYKAHKIASIRAKELLNEN